MYRIISLIKKEILVMLKDKRSRVIIIAPIIMQTLIVGYVANFDVTTVNYALFDMDKTELSKGLDEAFYSSHIFIKKYNVFSKTEIDSLIMDRKIQAALIIEKGFEKTFYTEHSPLLQFITDARNSNTASISQAYASEIIKSYLNPANENINTRSWYNSNMQSRWTMVSAMSASLTMMQLLIITALSVARERENGTLEQLLVTPLTKKQIMLGKAVPSLIVGYFQVTLVMIIAVSWFKVPFSGSYILIYAILTIYLISIIALGLIISAFSQNMQQAILFAFPIIMVFFLLSGLFTPVKSMPYIFQKITYLNPLRHSIKSVRKIYLEGGTLIDISEPVIANLSLSILFSFIALLIFTKIEG